MARGAVPKGVLPGLLAAAALLAPSLAPPGAAHAQLRPFTCVEAELLEDDVFAIPFGRGSATVTPAARANLDAAAALAQSEPQRNICVLGHVSSQEGGAETGRRLAARRARAVAEALAERGVERDRVRAEARVASFSESAEVPAERRAIVVVLPEAAPEEP